MGDIEVQGMEDIKTAKILLTLFQNRIDANQGGGGQQN